MKRFIFWTGVVSILAGAGFQFPAFAAVMASSAQGMLVNLFGFMAMFLGVMLIMCAGDLRRRGALVMWEGVLRICGSAVMAWYGLWGGAGVMAVAGGAFDFAVGVVYLVGLPRHLGVRATDLLWDRLDDRA